MKSFFSKHRLGKIGNCNIKLKIERFWMYYDTLQYEDDVCIVHLSYNFYYSYFIFKSTVDWLLGWIKEGYLPCRRRDKLIICKVKFEMQVWHLMQIWHLLITQREYITYTWWHYIQYTDDNKLLFFSFSIYL